MKPLIFLKDRQKHIPCVTDVFVNGTNKKRLGLVFVIFLFSAVPAAAKIFIVPVFPGLQKAFERGDLGKERLAQIRDSVRVKRVWPADIEADCTFRPGRLKFSLKEGGDISGKGLRFVLRTEKKNAGKRTFTIRSDGEAVLNEIRPEDLPARLEIPLLAKLNAKNRYLFRPYFLFGPAFAVKLRAKVRTGYRNVVASDSLDSIKRADYGLVIGGGVEVLHLAAEARLNFGLRKISEFFGLRNRVFSLLAGYRF